MKKVFYVLAIFCLTSYGFGQEDNQKEDYYGRTGTAALNSFDESLSISMLGWGIGLAGGIALLAGILHQSQAGNGNGHTHCQ